MYVTFSWLVPYSRYKLILDSQNVINEIQFTEFDIYQLMHFLYNNVLVYNVNIKTFKNT